LTETSLSNNIEDEKKPYSNFEELVSLMKNKLYKRAYSILNDSFLAEDAVSECFLQISKVFDSFDKFGSVQVEAYCMIVLNNACKNIIRSNYKFYKAISLENCDDIPDDFLANEKMGKVEIILLKEKLSRMKYEDKEVLMLYYYYQRSLKEIAEMKNVSYDQVQKHIQRARSSLKKHMEKR
jgi:RNA polymerase sigma-70 factor (ECF subfamily)